MARSIGHDEWEREVVQDIDERGRVRIVAGGVTCSFGTPPSPAEIEEFLAAHAPTPLYEARRLALAQALEARGADVDRLVRARAPPGTPAAIVDAEWRAAAAQMLEVVREERKAERQASRAQRESGGELHPLRPLTRDELLAARDP